MQFLLTHYTHHTHTANTPYSQTTHHTYTTSRNTVSLPHTHTHTLTPITQIYTQAAPPWLTAESFPWTFLLLGRWFLGLTRGRPFLFPSASPASPSWNTSPSGILDLLSIKHKGPVTPPPWLQHFLAPSFLCSCLPICWDGHSLIRLRVSPVDARFWAVTSALSIFLPSKLALCFPISCSSFKIYSVSILVYSTSLLKALL